MCTMSRWNVKTRQRNKEKHKTDVVVAMDDGGQIHGRVWMGVLRPTNIN